VTTPGGGRKRLAPVLLSLLVFPGLGQFATGRPWRGLAYAGASLALLVAVLRRVYAETLRLMPDDAEAVLDPALPFRLAAEIHRANAAFFAWATEAIVALWAASAIDAWAASRGPGRPSTHDSPPGPARPFDEGLK
jgi:hypothetical protein